MLTQEKPQPSADQVEIVDLAIRVVGETNTWIKPAMYPSGSMLLMVITEGGSMLVARFGRDGSVINSNMIAKAA